MFGELQKLFDRNFAVGFFLPSLVFVAPSAYLLNYYFFRVNILGLTEFYIVAVTTALAILSLLGGIVLVALNRDIYRFFEGYPPLNPLMLFGWFERHRYQTVLQAYEDLEAQLQAFLQVGRPFPEHLRRRYNALASKLAEEFPDQERHLLPTAFGNALRAFETFPHAMYGLDSIPIWGRLLAVTPREYLELLDGAKANVDFWVNLAVTFLALPIVYAAFALKAGHQPTWWLVAVAVPLEGFAAWRATSSAREWGHFVKAAFDVYSPRLREALGLEEPDNRAEEREQWEAYSRALVYRVPEELPELKRVKKFQPAPSSLPSPRGNRARKKR